MDFARGNEYPGDRSVPMRESGVIVVTGTGADALGRLDVFVGDWLVAVTFPGQAPPRGPASDGPQARARFEWTLDRQFLMQRTEVPVPGVPDSPAIVAVDLETGAYAKHYFDSRGVARLYAMSLADGVWTLTRESPDFTPLDFRQRFVGEFSQDGNVITGARERGAGGSGWEHDFGLVYRRGG
jgi:hypothetical protein